MNKTKCGICINDRCEGIHVICRIIEFDVSNASYERIEELQIKFGCDGSVKTWLQRRGNTVILVVQKIGD